MKKQGWLLVVVLCAAALGQQVSGQPASREKILTLFEVMHIRQQMRTMIEGVMQQEGALVKDSIRQRYPNVSEEEMKRMNAYISESMREMPVDGMLDDMIPVYQKHLTEADVDAMISFYSSATGQKLMQEMPAMTSEGMQAAYPRMQEQMDKVMRKVEEELKKDKPKQKTMPKSDSQT